MAQRSRTKSSPRRSSATLREYHRKRDLGASGEPGGARVAPSAALPRFVIQKHDATRLHYDLRLEMSGTLKSWAVPKGLPENPGDKSLAIEVEDHPLDYGSFEGVIPAGNYGAGTVMLWDRGFYTVGGGDPDRALRQGKIHFALAGEKMLGEWTLVRLRGEKDSAKTNWLVLRNHDASPGYKPGVDRDRSVLTGRTLDEIAASQSGRRSAPRAPAKAAKRPRRSTRAQPARETNGHMDDPSAGFVEPMKALAVERVPAGDWKLEIKFDGFRALALVRTGAVTLWSRNRKNLSADYPEVTAALRRLRCEEAVIDGELVALDAQGRSSFQLMQQRSQRGLRPPLHFYAFDLLSRDGKSLLGRPLEKRQAALAKLIGRGTDVVRLSPVFEVSPEELLEAARQQNLEGIIAKRSASLYEPGRRSGAWVKCRLAAEQEFVIGGFTPPQGARAHFGALLIGYYAGDKFLYAGKVGTGFDARLLREISARLRALAVKKSPFDNLPLAKRSRFGVGMTAAVMRTVTWVKPELVCQVRFTEWTDDGLLRHPVFLGRREDKKARDVHREKLAREK
ncbi:MAG: ATP-dependent DNA ligase [Opitutus sp.]|nr:ATP-dependent DNA ligase [Opitutus sp.]